MLIFDGADGVFVERGAAQHNPRRRAIPVEDAGPSAGAVGVHQVGVFEAAAIAGQAKKRHHRFLIFTLGFGLAFFAAGFAFGLAFVFAFASGLALAAGLTAFALTGGLAFAGSARTGIFTVGASGDLFTSVKRTWSNVVV